jgi:hypothetical protein
MRIRWQWPAKLHLIHRQVKRNPVVGIANQMIRVVGAGGTGK